MVCDHCALEVKQNGWACMAYACATRHMRLSEGMDGRSHGGLTTKPSGVAVEPPQLSPYLA